MESPLNHLTTSTRRIRLTSEAADRIRRNLVAYMRAHPMPVPPTLSPYQHLVSKLSPFTHRFSMPVMAGALVLLVGFGGATTYAAAGALPGNPLYPLKVNVLEPARGFLAVSPEAKAAWQASITETRLDEVERLATREAVTQEEGEKHKERFDRSLEAARVTIEKLSKDNPRAAARIKASLTASLDAHEAALTALATATTSVDATTTRLFARHLREDVDAALIITATTTLLEIAPEQSGRDRKNRDEEADSREGRSDSSFTASTTIRNGGEERGGLPVTEPGIKWLRAR